MAHTILMGTEFFAKLEHTSIAPSVKVELLQLQKLNTELVRIQDNVANRIMAQAMRGMSCNDIFQLMNEYTNSPGKLSLWCMTSNNLASFFNKSCVLLAKEDVANFSLLNKDQAEFNLEKIAENPQFITAYLSIVTKIYNTILPDTSAMYIHVKPELKALGLVLEDQLNCQVVFNARDNKVVLNQKNIAEQPLLTANPVLENLLSPSSTSPPWFSVQCEFVAQASTLIQHHLSHTEFSLSELAKLFCISPRTLQRKFEAASTSFGQLLEQERKKALQQKLEQGLTAEQLTTLLGYQDVSSIYKLLNKLN